MLKRMNTTRDEALSRVSRASDNPAYDLIRHNRTGNNTYYNYIGSNHGQDLKKMVLRKVLRPRAVLRPSSQVLATKKNIYTKDGQPLARVPNLARELISQARERGHGNEPTVKQQKSY